MSSTKQRRVDPVESAGPVSALEAFVDWRARRMKDKRDPLTESRAKAYQLLWEHWVSWLAVPPRGRKAPRAASWRHARAEDLALFLTKHGRSVRTRANSKSKGDAFAPSTQRRYLMVLRRIYENAEGNLHQELVHGNPAQGDLHTVAEGLNSSFVTPQVLDAIPQVLPRTDHWLDLRDRAMVLVALDAALAPAEMFDLKINGITRHLENSRVLVLFVENKRTGGRELELGEEASKALEAWLAARKGLQLPAATRDSVFVSMQLTPLSRDQLHPVVSRAVAAAYERVHGKLDAKARVRCSPMVLRNSRIAQWLRAGATGAEVAKRAGLIHEKSLARLYKALDDAQRLPGP